MPSAKEERRLDKLYPTVRKKKWRSANLSRDFNPQRKRDLEDFQEAGFRQVMWLTREDDLTCPKCRNLSGRVFRIPRMLKHPFPLTGFSHINCLPATQVVAGQFVAGLQAGYTGKIVEVLTRSGYKLSLTPNHPVLTSEGLVPAHTVRQGHHLVCDRHKVGSPLPTKAAKVGKENNPAPIKEVLELLRQLHPSRRAPATIDDLHGDAKGVDSDIEVVGANCFLLAHPQSVLARKNRSQGVFVEASMLEARAPSFCSCHLPRKWVNRTTPSLPRFRQLPFNLPPVVSENSPLGPLRFGLSPETNAALFHECPAKGFPADTSFVGKLLERGAGLVSLDQVVEIREYDFSGHVFDLQSTSGLMVAQGIYISNCRCGLIPVGEPKQMEPVLKRKGEEPALVVPLDPPW